MTKRVTISGLWFVAIWAVGGIFHVALDVPRAVIFVLAAAGAVAWYVGLGRYEAAVAARRTAAVDRVRVRILADTGVLSTQLDA
jgi:hypothetical protein